MPTDQHGFPLLLGTTDRPRPTDRPTDYPYEAREARVNGREPVDPRWRARCRTLESAEASAGARERATGRTCIVVALDGRPDALLPVRGDG